MSITETSLVQFLEPRCDNKAFSALAGAKALRTRLDAAATIAVQHMYPMKFPKPVPISDKERTTLAESIGIMSKLAPGSTVVAIQLESSYE